MGSVVSASEFMTARAARTPLYTQEDCIRFAIRASIAKLGPMRTDGDIASAAFGIAIGLFGEAFQKADDIQRQRWVDTTHYEYRKAIGIAD